MQHAYTQHSAPPRSGRWLPLAALFAFLLSPLVGWGQTTLVEWNFPNNPDDDIADGGIAANLTKTLSEVGAGVPAYTAAGVTTRAASVNSWNAGNGTKYWQIEVETTGYSSLTVASRQFSSSAGPRDFKVQYKVGAGGMWTDVPGATIQTGDATWATGGALAATTIPSAANNQSSVFLRWLMNSDVRADGTAGVASNGNNRIDNIVVQGTATATNTLTAPTIASGFPACVTPTVGQALGNISFTSSGAGFTGSVTYTAQLSDAAGAFGSPVALGSVTNSSGPGSYTISGATVPAATAAGTAYAVRIVTTTPAVTGSSTTGLTVVNSATNNATFPAPTPTATDVPLTWTNPTNLCWSGVVIVAAQGATVTATPSGTSFTANSVFGSGQNLGSNNYVVYQGTGTNVTVTNLTASTQYTFKIFTRTGTEYSAGVSRTITTAAPPAPAMVVKQNTTTYTSGGTAYNFGSVVQGASGSAVTFTIQNTGSANLTISTPLGQTGDYAVTTQPTSPVSGPSGSTTFQVVFTPTGQGTRTGTVVISSNDPTTPTFTLKLTGTGTASAASDIIVNSGFTYNSTGIDYAAKQTPAASLTNTSNALSEAIYSITIRDGGASLTDADPLPTIVSEVTFNNVQGEESIRAAALFNGNTLVSNAGVIGTNTISFTGLSFSVADGMQENLTLRVSFLATATDGQQVRVRLQAANVSTTGSSSTFGGFATLNSTIAAGLNELNVIATQLVFSPAPPATASVNTEFTVGVVAQDANGQQDTDFRGLTVPSVTLTVSGGTGALSSATGLTQTLTGGSFTWNDVQYSAVESGLTLSTTNTNSLANPTAPLNVVLFAGKLWDGQAGDGLWTSAANWSPNGVPTASDDVWLSHSSLSGAYTVTVSTAGQVARTLRIGDGGNTITLLLSSGTIGTDLLTVGAVGIGTALSIREGGVLNNNAQPNTISIEALSFADAANIWEMTGNGTYQHRQTNGSATNLTPGNTAFAATSNFEVYTSMSNYVLDTQAGLLNNIYEYGNLLLSPSSSSGVFRFSTALDNGDKVIVRGNLTLVNAGTLVVNQGNASATAGIVLRIGGNLSISAGSAVYASEDTGIVTTGDSVTVRGNVSGSGILGVATGSGGTRSGVVSVGGNLTGVQFTAVENGCQLVFAGGPAAVADFNPSTTPASTFRKVRMLKAVRLLRDLPSSGGANPITVESTGTLDFNGFNTTGSGPFTLVAGGTLKITDAGGIVQAASPTPTTGNVRNSGAHTFPNDAVYWYTGTVPQVTGTGLIPTNGAKTLVVDNPTTLTLTDPVASPSTGVEVRFQASALAPASQPTLQLGTVEILRGTLIETTTAEIVGTGHLKMSGTGTYRIVKTGTTQLPQLSGTYALAGGTVELSGAGNQVLKGTPTYYSLTFATSGTKTLTSSISNLSGVATISDAAVLDLSVGGVGLSGTGALTMSGTSLLRTNSTGVRPGLSGEYTLTGGSTIEFANTNATIQTIRANEVTDSDRTYNNILVTGTNVGASTGDFAIRAGALMSIEPGATFTMSSQTIDGAGAFEVKAGGTFGYGSPDGINATGATGNIRTGTRTFASAATYILRATGAMATGTALPAGVQNLTVSLGTAGQAATLTSPTTITGALTLTQGLLALDNADLTLPIATTITGLTPTTYIRTANNPAATGEVVRPVTNSNTDVLFPVGTSTYTPVLVRQAASAVIDDFRVRVFDGARTGGLTGTAVTTDAVNRTWMVDETTPGNANATIMLQWNAADQLANFDNTKCTVVHFEGGEWTNRVRDYVAATVVSPGVFRRARTGITSFSPFAVQDYQQVLPVELTRFAAAVTPKRTVALTWATATEKNADRFEVQRSRDGRAYAAIGSVAAQGTTTTVHEYAFEDGKPLTGSSYYRLRQIDLDGAEYFSGEVAVSLSGEVVTASLDTWPQPFDEALMLTLTTPADGTATVEVFDLSGRRVLVQALPLTVGATRLPVPGTRALTAGAYVVRVVLPSGPVLRERVVKQ